MKNKRNKRLHTPSLLRNAIRCKEGVASYASLLMPHCPVTVVQRYRDGVCSLLFHLCFIICHPISPSFRRNDFLILVLLIFGCADAGIKLGLYLYDATLLTSTLCYTRSHKPRIVLITRVRAGKVGGAHYPKWRRSLLIRAETRDFHEMWDWRRTIAWG